VFFLAWARQTYTYGHFSNFFVNMTFDILTSERIGINLLNSKHNSLVQKETSQGVTQSNECINTLEKQLRIFSGPPFFARKKTFSKVFCNGRNVSIFAGKKIRQHLHGITS
jgi:hypothetical protein